MLGDEEKVSFCNGGEPDSKHSMCDEPPTLEMRRMAALESIAESLGSIALRLEKVTDLLLSRFRDESEWPQ